jgi:hypothetical protein
VSSDGDCENGKGGKETGNETGKENHTFTRTFTFPNNLLSFTFTHT